jgi:hypothetical protein
LEEEESCSVEYRRGEALSKVVWIIASRCLMLGFSHFEYRRALIGSRVDSKVGLGEGLHGDV